MNEKPQRERMLADSLYMVGGDPILGAAYPHAQGILAEFNTTRAGDIAALAAHLPMLPGHLGEEQSSSPPAFSGHYALRQSEEFVGPHGRHGLHAAVKQHGSHLALT